MDAADPVTFSNLLDQHGARLVLYAQQFCDNPEDVVQEAFVRLMGERPQPQNLVGWLYRVVRNTAISASRATSRRARHEVQASAERQPWFLPASDEALDAATAAEALGQLPADCREVVVLRIWSGMSYEQIAELTGTSTSTAHRRYENGLRLLRENWSLTCPIKPTPP